MFNGHAGQPSHVVNIQLGHQVGPVPLHGFDANIQESGNPIVCISFSNELHYLALTRRELVKQARFLGVSLMS